MGERQGWLVPVHGGGTINGRTLDAGQCWLLEGREELMLAREAEALLAYPGNLRMA